ncbi:hypothetical protein BDW75DRAFT_233003 [Aspergillus navahoensis]
MIRYTTSRAGFVEKGPSAQTFRKMRCREPVLTPSAPRPRPLTRTADDDAKRNACHFCSAQYKPLSGKRKQASDLSTATKMACSTGLPCSESAWGKGEWTYHDIQPSTHLNCIRCYRPVPAIPLALLRGSRELHEANGLNEAYSYKSQLTTNNPSHHLHRGRTRVAEKARHTWDNLQCILDSLTAQQYRTMSSKWFEFFLPAKATRYLHLILSNSLFLKLPRLRSRNKKPSDQKNIQILQTTCFMCQPQKWEETVQAKLRMQRHQLTAFVATTRTFDHVFVLDAAFGVFHKPISCMGLQEMTIDLTCPEDVIQAASPAESTGPWKLHPPCTVPLLTDCVRNLCAETPEPDLIADLLFEHLDLKR